MPATPDPGGRVGAGVGGQAAVAGLPAGPLPRRDDGAWPWCPGRASGTSRGGPRKRNGWRGGRGLLGWHCLGRGPWVSDAGRQGRGAGLKSLLQHHSSKASILRRSAFFTVQLSHNSAGTLRSESEMQRKPEVPASQCACAPTAHHPLPTCVCIVSGIAHCACAPGPEGCRWQWRGAYKGPNWNNARTA